MEKLEREIFQKRDEINRHYWRFTRQARGNPPPAHLYKELSKLEDELKEKKRKHDPKWKDSTVTQRQQSRRAKLNAIAQAAGFASWSAFETACLNGQAQPTKREPDLKLRAEKI